ncbi:hypothetical protein WL93_23740 [Burkholderia diffusa]|nr:hypothetical protein WL93_23740 [Burkholderia diffusa]
MQSRHAQASLGRRWRITTEVATREFKLLGHFFAKHLQGAGAIGTDLVLFAFQMFGQWFAPRCFGAFALWLRLNHPGGTFVGLQILEPKLELFELTFDLLRDATELHPSQLSDRQHSDARSRSRATRAAAQIGDHRLERVDIVGEVGGRG